MELIKLGDKYVIYDLQTMLQQVLRKEVELIAVPGFFLCPLYGGIVLSMKGCKAYRNRIKECRFVDDDYLYMICPNECKYNKGSV